jgi:tetratricopeptide (TPR) repeat protein
MPEQHVWITGRGRQRRLAGLAGELSIVDTDRRLRGPYTGVGTVLRALVPGAWAADPELVRRHSIEIVCAAPELESLLGAPPPTLTSSASAAERTRWYSRLRTRRIAHGIVEFLRSYAANRPEGRLVLAFDGLDRADATDREFVAIALRRLQPSSVLLVVGAGAGSLPDELATALRKYAVQSTVNGEQSEVDGWEPAAHDERATELIERGEFSLTLGAIPYHVARGGGDPEVAFEAGRAALDYCHGMGFYDAVLDLAGDLVELIDRHPDQLGDYRYVVLMWTVQALTMLQRADEAEPILFDLLARTSLPRVHLTAYYQLGMLYTRHLTDSRKDHPLAKAYLNTSIAIAALLGDPEDRSFHEVFMGNGLALAEMHTGNLQRSYELVAGGLDRLDRELPDGKHLLHRSVLLHNRAQVLSGLGRPAEALADFDRVIEIDPNYPEYRFDRGNARLKAGDPAGAIADYESAMALTPPFPELYYNRGEARLALGDADGALADYRYVLDLEPDHLEARVSLAALLLEAGEPAAAATEATAGLAELPDDARLLCLLGQALEASDQGAALAALDRALAADPQLYQALVCRASIAYGQGRFDDAVGDLDRAVELAGDDPVVLFNRGWAHEAAGRPGAAIADYDRALALPGADQDELLAGRDRCLALNGSTVH